jgi:cysteine protease ATG4
MLMGFLIKNRDDWEGWKHRIASTPGKPIIHVFSRSDTAYCQGRKEALDEVEALDDE